MASANVDIRSYDFGIIKELGYLSDYVTLERFGDRCDVIFRTLRWRHQRSVILRCCILFVIIT